MPPALTRLSTPVRPPSLKDCDPSRLVVPSSCILSATSFSGSSSSAASSASSSGPSSPLSSDQARGGSSSRTIRLAHSQTGKRWAFSIKDGVVVTKQVDVGTDDSTKQDSHRVEEDVDDDYDVSEDAHLCEAVLRSLFAPSVPAVSLEQRVAQAELVEQAFALEDSIMQTVLLRAKKAAQYRRAELQVLYEELQQDKLPHVNSEQFENPQHYTSWKERELQELSGLVSSLGALPAFSGSVRVDLISIEDVKPVEVSCMLRCRKQPPRPHMYASVTVLPSRNSGKDCDKEPAPAFITEVVVCSGLAQWQTTTPWIPVTSVQDKVLIEVWDKQVVPRKTSRKSKSKLKLSRRSSKMPKVAPWSGDAFVGQVILAFNQVESEALRPGRFQGVAPPMSYMLADEKGRQKTFKLQLRFACSSERCHREMPSSNLLLRPPLADIDRGFDMLIGVALRFQKNGTFELEKQWRCIVATFGTHYRLRTQRCSLGILMGLAQKFQQDLRYLTAIVSEWLPVCESAREGCLTKNELSLHMNVVSVLIKPAIDAIENFQSAFPKNQPPGALVGLLKLLGLVLRWDPNPDEILIPLKSWIKNSCEKRFYFHLFGDGPSTEQPTNITPQRLMSVVNLVRKDLASLQDFAGTFPESICLSGVAIPAYYKLVAGYVMNAIRAAQVKLFTKDHEGLVVELLSFHKDIEKAGQQCDLMDLHGIFKEHIVQLVGAAKTRMVDWVSSSVTTEKWEPLSSQTGALFSFSIVDLYFMIGEVMDQLLTRLTAVPFGNQHFNQVEDAICSAVKAYVEILEVLCLQEIPDEAAKSSEGFGLCISKQLCVKVNNMNAVLEQHQDLEERLNETLQNQDGDDDTLKLSLFSVLERHSSVKDGLNSKFKEVQHFTQQAINNVVESIVENLQGRLSGELQYVLRAVPNRPEPLDEQLQSLTGYLDQHLIVMNDYLHPSIFQRMISEICKGLIFCMEEYALNKDEDPSPMTLMQRETLAEILDFFYGYFYGDGVGISNEKMDALSARLKSILSCWDLDTRELCALYWQAWDAFNDCSSNPESDSSTSTLHLLDYLWLLRQRTDDEACEIVDRQQFIANKRMMQFMFGLPKEEELVAAYACRRNFQKAQGTLYITSKHVCFKDTKRALADSRMLFVMPIDRLMRIELSGRSSIVLIPFHQRPTEFSKFPDRDTVCRTIFSQVAGTGSHLEKSMAPIWSKDGVQHSSQPINAIRVFKCWRQGMLHRYSGTLLLSTAFILFTQDDKNKVTQMDHTNIARIHADRRGLRPSGVVIELKSGDEFEFCNFQAVNMSNKEIARELETLVFGNKK